MKGLVLILALLIPLEGVCYPSAEEGIVGFWYDEEKDAKIEIYENNGKYYGRIVWAQEPVDKETGEARTRFDDKNPDPVLRKRPIVGLVIMEDFIYAGKNKWKGGKVYDPKTGKTYRGSINLASPNELRLRGFIAFSFLGRSTVWRRAAKNSVAH